MLQGEHSAIFSTFIKLPFVIKIFVLSFFLWPFYTAFTVHPFLISSPIIAWFHYPNGFTNCMENRVDPDQLASLEAR